MNAPTLNGVQRLFLSHLQYGDVAVAERMRSLVVGDDRADAAERIAVYEDAYRLRLIEALTTDYPTLRAVLGVPEFERLCRAYIDAHPSTTPSIRWFGRYLAAFLVSAADWTQRPVLAELATFEWTQGETFDSPDAATMTIAQVAAVPPASWPGMRLLPHPSVRRLDLRWNVPEIVKAENSKKKRPPPKQKREVTAWLMWRDAALDIRWRSMSEDEVTAFDAASGNRSFADVCELLCEFVDPEQAPMQAASLLKRWVSDGLIADLELPPN